MKVKLSKVAIALLVSKYFEQINVNNNDLNLDKNWLCPKLKVLIFLPLNFLRKEVKDVIISC